MSKLKTITACLVGIAVTVHVLHTTIVSGAPEASPWTTGATPVHTDVTATQASLATEHDSGLLDVQASIAGSAPMSFILDSGASGVTISRSTLNRLIVEHRVAPTDFLQNVPMQMANGKAVQNQAYMLKSVTIAGHTLQNVPCIVGDDGSLPLLGQSVLARFNSWTIDNKTHTLTVA
jgi:predicted aspartyl protease